MARTAGKRGRRPQRQGADRFAIRWASEYLAAPVPAYPIDVSQGIRDFGMDGNGPDPSLTDPPAGVNPNTGVGDCGVAAYEHERMLAGASPTANETVALYWQYTGGQDDGVVIADWLLWLYRQKMIEGFAPVELGTVDAVMAQFARGVLLGVNLTDDADQLFNEGKPWTVGQGEQPDPSEGHVVLKVGAMAEQGNGVAVTWGALQEMEHAWEAACIEEAWVIVTKDDMGEAAYAALMTDLEALPNATDVPPPVPVPPAPTPSPPVPVPDPPVPPVPTPIPPSDLWQRVKAIIEAEEKEAIAKIKVLISEIEG